MVATLCFIFVALVGVLFGAVFDRAHGSNNALPDCAGSILIYSQDGEAYLFLDTELSPEELAKHSTVMFKVETRNVQSAL